MQLCFVLANEGLECLTLAISISARPCSVCAQVAHWISLTLKWQGKIIYEMWLPAIAAKFCHVQRLPVRLLARLRAPLAPHRSIVRPPEERRSHGGLGIALAPVVVQVAVLA